LEIEWENTMVGETIKWDTNKCHEKVTWDSKYYKLLLLTFWEIGDIPMIEQAFPFCPLGELVIKRLS
jgi:hypothetical protein